MNCQNHNPGPLYNAITRQARELELGGQTRGPLQLYGRLSAGIIPSQRPCQMGEGVKPIRITRSRNCWDYICLPFILTVLCSVISSYRSLFSKALRVNAMSVELLVGFGI